MTAPATGLGFGVKRVVEGDFRTRQRALEGDGAEVVLRHARQGQRGLRLEAETAVIVRIPSTTQPAACRSCSSANSWRISRLPIPGSDWPAAPTPVPARTNRRRRC